MNLQNIYINNILLYIIYCVLFNIIIVIIKYTIFSVWNSFKSFKCKNCNNLFLPEQQVTCLYHPKESVNNDKEYSV